MEGLPVFSISNILVSWDEYLHKINVVPANILLGAYVSHVSRMAIVTKSTQKVRSVPLGFEFAGFKTIKNCSA